MVSMGTFTIIMDIFSLVLIDLGVYMDRVGIALTLSWFLMVSIGTFKIILRNSLLVRSMIRRHLERKPIF